jgi:E3 ubiquitin-protein ligase RHF
MSDIGSDVRREVNAGIASVSRMMECLETRENSSTSPASVENHLGDFSVTEQNNQNIAETHGESPLNDSNRPASCAASSASS